MKLYLDTCSWINLILPHNSHILKHLMNLINDSKIKTIISHAVNDEIKSSIENIPKELVPTGCSIVGYSRIGYARLGDPDGVYDKLTNDLLDKAKNRRSVWDAIHYATAHFEKADYFVTDDGPLKEKIKTRIINHVRVIPLIDLLKI